MRRPRLLSGPRGFTYVAWASGFSEEVLSRNRSHTALHAGARDLAFTLSKSFSLSPPASSGVNWE